MNDRGNCHPIASHNQGRKRLKSHHHLLKNSSSDPTSFHKIRLLKDSVSQERQRLTTEHLTRGILEDTSTKIGGTTVLPDTVLNVSYFIQSLLQA